VDTGANWNDTWKGATNLLTGLEIWNFWLWILRVSFSRDLCVVAISSTPFYINYCGNLDFKLGRDFLKLRYN
jgi:hypothetical protein